jgi:CHAT domain-containing protein/tetratricopeptide (TPR) repeat protein
MLLGNELESTQEQIELWEQIFEELGCAEGKLRAQLQRLNAIRPKTLTEIRQMERIADDFEALDSPEMQITALSHVVCEGADILPWSGMVNTFAHLERLLTRTSNRYGMLLVSVEFSAAAILRQEHIGKTIEYLQKCVNVASQETPKTTGQLSMQLGQAYRSLGDQDRSLKYAKMAVNMFDRWGLQDMVSDATLELSIAMTSETPGPNHEAAIEMLKGSLSLDAKRNDVQRQLQKLEAIARLEGCLAGSDQGDRHKELQVYWMEEWERLGEVSQNDPLGKAQLFMARGRFEKAEDLLRQCLVNSMDKRELRRISKCQNLLFSCLFLSFGSSLHPEEKQTQVGAIVDQATAALAAYQELGPYSVPLEFILQVSHAFESLGQSQDGQERARLYSEALQYLEIGESISERLRRDLSSSPGLESLHQKQMLVASSPHSGIFHRALALTLALSDAEKMWRWTQKAKARALSDVVGSQLDSYPRHCPPGIAADDQIVSLLEEEARLVRKLESAVSLEKISTSMELERVRSTMERHPVLGRLLASRAGKTDLQDLQWLFGNGKGRDHLAGSKVVLVDWVVIGDTIVMLTLDASLKPQMSVLDITLTDVRVWKQRYLSSHTSLVSATTPLYDKTLAQLNGLVSGLSEFSHEGDLLVFCPTKTMHAIALHALEIEGVPVISRNPVVYTASVSLLRQCCEKADSKLCERARRLRTAFFSAYYDHTKDTEETRKREEAYACVRKLASDFGSEPRVGCDANRANLMKVVKDADILHFHGHTATHPNILYQSLVLSDGKTQKTSSDEQGSHKAHSSTSPYRPTLGPYKDAFTVRDAFSLHFNLSIASIIACSSGVQDFGAGDEPQGLLSALQYAGCATAIGTLWPVRSEDGRDFARYFFQSVRCQGNTTTSPWNLALSFQKAVKRLLRRKDSGLHHPYYWAAFVMHGAWYL